jgi:hypothetical protein
MWLRLGPIGGSFEHDNELDIAYFILTSNYSYQQIYIK